MEVPIFTYLPNSYYRTKYYKIIIVTSILKTKLQQREKRKGSTHSQTYFVNKSSKTRYAGGRYYINFSFFFNC